MVNKSLLVRSAHVFVLPLFHYVLVENALVPKAVKSILCLFGKILT